MHKLKYVFAVFSILVFLPFPLAAQDRITRIHESCLTLDTHTDSPMAIYSSGYNMAEKHDARKDGSRLDFVRMKEGGLDAAFFAVFTGQGPRTTEGYGLVKKIALGIIDSIYAEVNRHPELAAICYTPDEAIQLHKKHKRAIFIGMENGYPVGTDISLVDTFYKLGVRYITICHSRNNDLCHSSTDTSASQGLTSLGRMAIQRMNQLGIMIDISHVSDSSFYEAVKLSKVPVIASHSDCRALCNNQRNLTDNMIRALAANGGVLQLCLLSDYVKALPRNIERDTARNQLMRKYGDYNMLNDSTRKLLMNEWYVLDSKYPPNMATVSDLADQVDHVVHLVGIDHVGIGSDFDGGGALKDCYDVSEMKNITAELLRRGYSKRDLKKLWSGNLFRVMKLANEFARKSQSKRHALSSNISRV